jgi:hypothetical protein
MKKNPNKKAGEWGALNEKPINQIYFKAGGSVKGKIPKGYHIMPNGKLMKDSAHNKLKKK